MTAPEGVERLRGVARRLLWGGLVCLVLPALAWLGTALSEGLAPTADGGGIAGRLAALLMLYVAPVGLVLALLGVVAAVWARWLGRERPS